MSFVKMKSYCSSVGPYSNMADILIREEKPYEGRDTEGRQP